ncbi:winged helix-turn-helix domain-containing protein [Pseudoduganella buxea]|uniref:OmpR/PhoB-type domain-containing protein n=2 Tax=Pseudoduganella buxea TaxID=1949069 RepID=A0ABQ1K7P2_9BURK|nr:winged helix-turn-helix domain-containing protein [Pseudoduganella buxea]GGB88203.1 hypothetical protein GCM10011572_07810 [Pseudoduganella buxea]
MDMLRPNTGRIALGRHVFDPVRGALHEATGRPVPLGWRAARVLQALVEARGQVLSAAQLLARAWPGQAIHASNLRVQIGALRRALAPDDDVIATVPGQGYRFTGASAAGPVPASRQPVSDRRDALPPAPALVGRATLADALLRRCADAPILTLTGAAGIGKSALALAVAQRFTAGRRCIVDVDGMGAGGIVPAIASALRLAPGAGRDLPTLGAGLPEGPLLLVLDDCDHHMEAVSAAAEWLTRCHPGLCVLATSRQTLRADGETVVRVPPLDGAAAMQLFLDHAPHEGAGVLVAAAADGIGQAFGVPLALVLAARALGGGTSHAVMPPRHRSLDAALAWAEPLLPTGTGAVLAALASLHSWFGLADATALLSAIGIAPAQALDSLATLAAHSLLTVDTTSAPARYRLSRP